MTAQLSHSRVVRGLYLVLGLMSLGLALIGVVVPLLPTTVFILIAAFFFARSSQRLSDWISSHKRFGPLIRDYRAGLGISLGAKAWAVAAIVLSFGLTMVVLMRGAEARLGMALLGTAIIWYVVSRPTKMKPASVEAGSSSNGSLET